MGQDIFRAYDGDSSIIVWLLEPHEIEGNKKFYIESYGDPALTAEQIHRLSQAVANADR